MKFFLLFFPLFLYAESLKSLIEFATNTNELISSKNLKVKAKKSEVTSSENELFPTIDVGAYYQRSDDPSPFMSGTTYSGYAKIGYDLYTGGKKSNVIKQKTNEFKSSKYDFFSTKNSIELAIVQDFYNIKSAEAKLFAREEASKAVEAQLIRMQKFYKASLATSDDVDRLQSAYDSNIYAIETLKFEILSLKKSLELKVGKEINSLDSSKFQKVDDTHSDDLDGIKSLKAIKDSIVYQSEIIDSYYYPQLRLEDTYSLYGYADEPSIASIPIKQITNQNKLMATLNFRVVDFGVLSEAKKSVLLQAEALNEQIKYQTKEQKLQLELAQHRIKTAKLNIKSAASALKSGNSALKTITQKYNSGIVDNVVYLDALSSQTDAKARYETSLNNLELAYALYYFYNAKKLQEYLND